VQIQAESSTEGGERLGGPGGWMLRSSNVNSVLDSILQGPHEDPALPV
jgi:hypothetical protein